MATRALKFVETNSDKGRVKPSQSKTRKNDDKSWIFILLLLLGMGLIYASQMSAPRLNSDVSGLDNDSEKAKRVDNHLKDTAFNVDADKRQRTIEVYQQLDKFHHSTGQSTYKESRDFTLESDPYMQSLTQELDRSQQAPAEQTPEEIVQQRLYENQQFEKANAEYRRAYAEQFVENARRGGWDVQLGPHFEVLSVKKLKDERKPSLFHEGELGGSR